MIFHRIWFDQPESECPFNRFWDGFKRLHPASEFVTWSSSAEVRSMISNPGVAAIWDAFIETDPYGRIPDIARYVILEHIGGYYVDTDVEPLRPWDVLPEGRPIIGWEDDKEASTSVLISPAHHPAIVQLLGELPEWQVRQHRRLPTANPVAETGPRFATAKWRYRDDVLRLPPVAFFPVHWKQMPLLGLPYPDRSYSVHHWASGWKTAKEKDHVQDIVLLAPKADRAFYACYLPEAQWCERLDEAEGQYVVELERDIDIPVPVIRDATRRMKESRRPLRFTGDGVRIWRRDMPESTPEAL